MLSSKIILFLICPLFSLCMIGATMETTQTVYNKKLLGAKEDGINRMTPQIMNKDFWLLLDLPFHRKQYIGSSVKDEPMFKEAGLMVHTPTVEKNPVFSRLALRQMEVYGPGKSGNIASEAEVSANADSATIYFSERITSGDTSKWNISYSKPIKKGDTFQKGWFALTFREPRKINRVVLYHGYWNGEGFDYIPGDFRLEYKTDDNGEWREIPGTKLENNLMDKNDLVFPVLTAKAVRMVVNDSRRDIIISIDPVEKMQKRKAAYADFEKTPFLIMPNSYDKKLHRVNLQNLDFKIKKDKYVTWKEKYRNSFLGFMPGEWDNDFNICSNWTGAGGGFRKAHEMSAIIPKPSNREEALAAMRDYFQKRKSLNFDDIIELNCFYRWDHYALEWGNNTGGIETTGAGSHQCQIAFVRGAARQYNKPWGWYMAYYWGYIQNPPESHPCSISPPTPAPRSSSPFGGISVSLAKRDYYLAFLNGASFLTHEDFPHAFFQPSVADDYDSLWKLSAHGETLKEWYAFTKRYPDRGVSYAPVALLLDYHHGWSPNGISGARQNVIFYCLPMGPCDHMITTFMYTLFPWFPDRKDNDSCLFNSPYGDLYDVLIANPPSGNLPLADYKAAILLGDVKIDTTAAEKLTAYVKTGGTLVMNVKQADKKFPADFLGASFSGEIFTCGNRLKSLLDGESFSLAGEGNSKHPVYECEAVKLTTANPILVDENNRVIMALNKYGKGTVILTTPHWLVEKGATYGEKKSLFAEFLVKHMIKEILPIQVDGDIEYGLNKVDDGWLLYLINNKGVYKKVAAEEAILNPRETACVKIRFNKTPGKVMELREEREIPCNKTAGDASIDIEIPPGDIKIIKITMKNCK